MKTGQARFDLDGLLDMLAERVAVHLGGRIGHQPHGTGKRLLNVAEAADYIGRSKASMQHMIASGALPVVRFDRRIFVDVQDLDDWIRANKIGAA